MTGSSAGFRLDNHLPAGYLADALRADVYAGLTSTPKALPPKWFYDEAGGQLFEEITRLPEYYPTRAEREILSARSAAIAERTGAAVLVELGAGSAEKTRLLLTALHRTGTLRRYVPVDVNAAAVLEVAQALRAEYPRVSVHGVVADFETQLDLLPAGQPRLTAFLGGTIGNFEPVARRRFLAEARSGMRAGDWLLLGTDLVKSPDVLVPAYDDSAGVTARFNRNVLYVVNRELKADFDPSAFDHVAVWDPDNEWIEMRLRSTVDQEVRVEELDLTVTFVAGEQMRTEVSAKFRRERVETELAQAGFTPREWWTDPATRFAVSLSLAG
ncbi:MAG TPA: L-histidine N(alpha)-methyltransferase [Mycobacteriales bacterium]|nr:L-histidine N(alpha)-methyltransferase [Mycobacteriales bacterium]